MKTTAGSYSKLGLILRGVAVVLALAVSQQSLAESRGTSSAYNMMAIVDVASGRLVVKGAYDNAIDKLARVRYSSLAFEAQNNLCVSYTKTGNLEQAAIACDAAVKARVEVTPAAERRLNLSQRQLRRDQAIALSNRGVLRAIAGDYKGAKEDFLASMELYAGLTAPKTNLDYLVTALPKERAAPLKTG